MKTIIPLNIAKIDNDGFHLFINVTINRKKVNVVIDTGASQSAFDEDKIAEIISKKNKINDLDKLSTGLGSNTLSVKTTVLKSLKVGKLSLINYNAIVLDMSHINSSYEKINMPHITGVIGGDILFNYNAVIDYKNKKLILEDI